MRRLLDPPLRTTEREAAPLVAAVLPHSHDRPLLRTAIAFAQARRGRLRAFAFHEPGESLPPSLRRQLYGLWGMSPADRALRHLIDSAVRGAHVPVRRVEEGQAVHALGDRVPLIAGWVRGRSRPEPSELRALLLGHPGDAALVADQAGPAFSEVLALGDGAALRALTRPLGLCYPLYEVPAPDEAAARRALRDASAQTLVVLGLPPGRLGPFAPWAGALEDVAPGTVVAALPRGRGRAGVVEGLIGG